jgi:hypothetical protein
MDDEEAALLAAAIELSLRDTGGPAEQPDAAPAAPSRNSLIMSNLILFFASI